MEDGIARFLTLKSGYRTLNDSSGGQIADAVSRHFAEWAGDKGVAAVHFTFGTLYGTYRQSNKKDWHILRRVHEHLGGRATVLVSPEESLAASYQTGGVTLTVDVRLGLDYWDYLGAPLGADAFTEFSAAFIRAAVRASTGTVRGSDTVLLPELREIASLDAVPPDYNVALLQRSQLAWLFMVAAHYCDELQD